MPVTVSVPIRIRVDPKSLSVERKAIAQAVSAALGRALANSRDVVLQKRSGYARVVLHSPELRWSGEALGAVASSVRLDFERGLKAWLEEVIKAANLHAFDGRGRSTTALFSEPAAEPIDARRLDAEEGTYTIPSYDGGGKPVKVRYEDPSGDPAAEKQLKRRLIGKLKEKDDEGQFAILILNAAQALPNESVEFRVLKDFASGYPYLYRKKLREYIDQSAETFAKELTRRKDDFALDKKYFVFLDAIRNALDLSRKLPGGDWLLKERERKLPGITRAIALVEALIEARTQLQAYLEGSGEPTDAFDLKVLRAIINGLPRLSAMLIAIVDQPSAKDLIAELEVDLVENIRWVNYVTEKFKDIDAALAIYRLFYGEVAKEQDEVKVLLEARRLYLRDLTMRPVPKAAVIAQFLKRPNDYYSDWHGKAADQKLERLRNSMVELRGLVSHIGYSAYGDYFRDVDHEVNREIDKLRKTAAEIEGDVKGITSTDRSIAYLNRVIAIEQKIPGAFISASLLSFWVASLQVTVDAYWHDIGSSSDRGGWSRRASKVREEIKAQYKKPDHASLPGKFEAWKKELESIGKDVSRTAKKEFYINLGITVVAVIVTAGAGAAAGAARLSLLAVTVVEAGTFTAVTTIGQAALLDKPVNPAEVAGSFVENAAFFGAFRVFNIGLIAAARKLAPEKVLTQLALIFGTHAVIAVGVPTIASLIQSGNLTEETGAIIAVNFVLVAGMALFTGPKLRTEMLKLDAVNAQVRQQVYDQALKIYNELGDVAAETQALARAGVLTEEQVLKLQARTAKLAPEFEALLRRLAGSEFSDAALAKLGLTRTQLKDFADAVPKYAALVAGLKYETPAALKGLPAPSELAGTAIVRTGPSTFEYNPQVRGQSSRALALRLRRAGYEVTESGGVLQLTGPKGGEPRLLLLPAAEPGAVEFPRTLLEAATGYRPAPELAQIQADLNKVNSSLIKDLGTYPRETGLAALGLMVEQLPKLTTPWPINAVRGLAEMLRLELGITRATVRHLFADLSAAELPALFEKFLAIATSKNVKPGARYLVGPELKTADSVKLVEGYVAIKFAGLQLPENMTQQAVFGLLRLMQDNPGDFVTKLGAVKVGDRLTYLESVSPRKVPKPPPPSAVEALLRKLTLDVRPGINLARGSSETVVQALEALAKPAGGRFSEPQVRSDFIAMIDGYRVLLGKLQAGANIERNIIGARNEIVAIVAALEEGTIVFSIGPVAKVKINPGLFDLPRSYTLENAPAEVPVQIDVGTQTVDGRLVVSEVTTGELSLPEFLKGLDPQSGEPTGGKIDYAKFNKSDASHRKFLQMIHIRAAAKFATELAKAFSGLSGSKAQVQAPDMVIKVGKASAPAKRVAKELGFNVIETGK